MSAPSHSVSGTAATAGWLAGVLYVVFVLSGGAGLVYESIWSRYLGLFVGHSAYAQVLVLVIFLGGMSLGAAAAGRRSTRLRNPLRWYAYVELIVGVLGLLFHDVFLWTSRVAYDSIFPALPSGAPITIAKWLLGALLILPQSVLLGATFPLMSAGVLRRLPERAGSVLALLYFSNSLGAAVGVLIAGFWLIAVVGLPGTLAAAAATNIFVAILVLVLTLIPAETDDRELGPPALRAAPPPPAPFPERVMPLPAWRPLDTGGEQSLGRTLLLVAFGTAAASFIYEIAWIRMLSLVLGSATHAFELMLSAFILGLALGALWVRRRADRFDDPVRALALVQWAMGLLAVATLPLYLASFGWLRDLIAALDTTNAGYRLFNVARYGIALAVMLPATFCAGITLPLITRTLLALGRGERAVGQVYAWNTLGSIAGASLAGLVLLPLLGLKALLAGGAMLDVALGVYLVWRAPARRDRERIEPAIGLGVVFVILLIALATPFDRVLLTSGVFRLGRIPGADDRSVIFYHDGRTATVSAHRTGGYVTIATNGKPDASLSPEWIEPVHPDAVPVPLAGDQSTQALLPLITLAYNPGARTAAVIGQGSGMSSHFLLGSPTLQRLTTIDIEPEMIRGSRRAFYPANKRVFDDPRSTFAVADAKSYFASAGQRFDLILSEPSNPWVSGVSGLFTTEFYARLRRYLGEDGVFGQWLHLYEIDDALVLGVIAAVQANFASYEIYLVANTDILIVASMRDSLPEPNWSVVHYPGIAEDLQRATPLSPSSLDGLWLANRATLAPVVRLRARPNSDFHPTLDLGAERTRFLRERATGFTSLNSSRFDVASALAGRRVGFSTDGRATVAGLPRLEALALGTRLRVARDAPDSVFMDPTLEGSLYRLRTIEERTATSRPPSSWRRWVTDVLRVEGELHGGTAGVVDVRFFDAVLDYMKRTSAPVEAMSAVRFARALAEWDFSAAAREADTLLAAAERGDQWVSVELLRDGGVTAKLQGSGPGAARAFYRRLTALGYGSDELRTMMLAAYLQEALARETGGRDSAARDTAAVPATITR